MRILLLNQFYRPDTAATGQYVSDLAEQLARRGHDVHVICSQRTYDGDGSCVDQEQTLDAVKIHRIGASGFGRATSLGRLADYASFYVLALLRALRLPKMDLCLSLTTPPFIALIGDLLKSLRGTFLVSWTMDLYPEVLSGFGVLSSDGWAYKILARLSRRLYHRSDAIISLGDVMTNRLIDAGANADTIRTVHNWVPGENVQPHRTEQIDLRSSWGLAGKVVLMYSGNLGLGHELDTVVRALAKAEGRPELTGVFVGRGKMRQPLVELVSALGLTNVHFRPPQPLERLGRTLAIGDIHVVSQRPGTEGLIVPSKIYGILAAGRPVIYIGPENTDVSQIVRDSHAGIIVPNGDVEAFADAVRALANDGERRQDMGRRGREFYRKHFGKERSVDRIVGIIEGVGLGRSGPVPAR